MSLLGGRVRHEQAADGHRTGIEPVLLAASVPARAGELVLEGGTGAGAALLCLAFRTGAGGTGIEIDPAQAELARANVAANGFGGVTIVSADLLAARLEGEFDHAMTNPPWHDPADTPSADPARALARRTRAGLLAGWVAALARPLRHRGTLTLALPAAMLAEALAALPGAGCGSPSVYPLWPRAGVAAKLILLRAVKAGRADVRLLPGLVLHETDGAFTARADAVLRDGAALEW